MHSFLIATFLAAAPTPTPSDELVPCGLPLLVGVTDFDKPTIEQYVRFAVTFWGAYAGEQVAYYSPGLKDGGGRYQVTVRVATVDDMRGWPYETFGRCQKYKYDNCLIGARILLDLTETWPDDVLAALVIHEVGHALGIGHSAEKGTVMYKTIPMDVSIRPGKDTLRELRAILQEVGK